MVRQRKKHHFWRNLLILLVLFGIYLYWGNSSIETDEATFTSGALPAGFDGCRIVHLSDLHGNISARTMSAFTRRSGPRSRSISS